MDCEKALKSGMIIATLFVAIILTVQYQQAQAADDENFFSSIGAAINAGRDAGEEDARNGNDRDLDCPNALDVPACLAYDDGYYKAYDAVKLVG
jgi:hypothetical protein